MQQGWKQMLRNAKTPARHGRVGAETEGTPSRTVTHSHQLIDFIKKEKKKVSNSSGQTSLCANDSKPGAVTSWPWLKPLIDFLSFHKQSDDKQALFWIINLQVKVGKVDGLANTPKKNNNKKRVQTIHTPHREQRSSRRKEWGREPEPGLTKNQERTTEVQRSRLL